MRPNKGPVEDEEQDTYGGMADEGKFFLGKVFMSCMVHREDFQQRS